MKRPKRFSDGYYRAEATDAEVRGRLGSITELRVHGVSGAPPEELVNDPHPIFIAGDAEAAFFRRPREPEDGPEREIEAYSWSGINSRSRSRAFLLLLFPFAMVNHAGWMIGPKPGGGGQRALIRLLGLVLTVHYVLAIMVVSVDLLAYQCGGSPSCRGRYLLGWFDSILRLVGPSPIRHVIVFSAFPLFVLFLLVRGGKSRGAYDLPAAGGGTALDDDGSPAARSELIDRIPLADHRFWELPEAGGVQSSAHGAAALAVAGATVARVLASLSRPGAGELSAFRLLEIALWTVAGTAAVLTLGAGLAQLDAGSFKRWRAGVRASAVLATALLAGVAGIGWRAPPVPERLPMLPDLNLSFDLVLVAELVVVLLFFLFDQVRLFFAVPLIGSALFWAITRDPLQPLTFTPWPAAPWLQFLVGGVLAAALSAGIYLLRNLLSGSRNARTQNGPDDPVRHVHNQFWIFFGLAPVAICAFLAVRAAAGAPIVWAVAFGGVGICAGYLMAMSRIQIRRCHDYPTRWRLKVGGPGALAAVGAIALTLVSSAAIVFVAQLLGTATPIARAVPVTRSATTSIGYYDELGWIAAAGLGALIVFALAFGTRVVALWRYRFAGAVPDIRTSMGANSEGLAVRNAKAQMYASLLDDLDWTVSVGVVAFMASAISVLAGQFLGLSAEQLDRLVGLASWLLVILVLVLVWVVRTAHKDTGIRKAIGTLWEVTGFFPRRFHPLAPPSYGERAVPELRRRLTDLTDDGGTVLVLAHSQGTLLCACTLLGFLGDPGTGRMDRMRLVTYGSMLQRSYARSFPHLIRRRDLFLLKARLEGIALNDEFEDFPLPPADRLPRWMNFGRTTDFLGGRLFLPPHRPPGCVPEQDRFDDVFFDDPPRPDHAPHGGRIALWLHSFDYLNPEEDPRLAAHVLAVLAEMKGEAGTRQQT